MDPNAALTDLREMVAALEAGVYTSESRQADLAHEMAEKILAIEDCGLYLDRREVDALRAVVGYMHPSEFEDYEAHADEEQVHHILHQLNLLRQALGEEG